VGLAVRGRRRWENGRMFRWFMLAYLGWRFAVEFVKPREIRLSVGGVNFSAIQVASFAGVVVCGWLLARRRSESKPGGEP
jgi:prolipoprotein diacylglyceryltransferase